MLTEGGYVANVQPGGPAWEELILREGDHIISINGIACADLSFAVSLRSVRLS